MSEIGVWRANFSVQQPQKINLSSFIDYQKSKYLCVFHWQAGHILYIMVGKHWSSDFLHNVGTLSYAEVLLRQSKQPNIVTIHTTTLQHWARICSQQRQIKRVTTVDTRAPRHAPQSRAKPPGATFGIPRMAVRWGWRVAEKKHARGCGTCGPSVSVAAACPYSSMEMYARTSMHVLARRPCPDTRTRAQISSRSATNKDGIHSLG